MRKPEGSASFPGNTTENIMIKGTVIPQVLLSNIVAYLMKRPYEEVAGFLMQIQKCPTVDMTDDGKHIESGKQ